MRETKQSLRAQRDAAWRALAAIETALSMTPRETVAREITMMLKNGHCGLEFLDVTRDGRTS